MIESFTLRALPASRVVNVKHAVRVGHAGTILVGANGALYYSALTRDQVYAHRVRIPDNVIAALVALGSITQADADDYKVAVKQADAARDAYHDLQDLERVAKERGVLLGTDDPALQSLRDVAAMYDPENLTW